MGALTEDNFTSVDDWTVVSSVTINTDGFAYPTAGGDAAQVYYNINSTDDIIFSKATAYIGTPNFQRVGAIIAVPANAWSADYMIDIQVSNDDIAIREQGTGSTITGSASTGVDPASAQGYCFKITIHATKGAIYLYKLCDVSDPITDDGWSALYDSTAAGNNNGRNRGSGEVRAWFGWRDSNANQHADGIAYYSTTPPPNNYTFSRNITEQPTSDLAFAVNSTIGFGNEIIWTNPFQPCVEALYYNSSTIFAVGNSSEICNYEIESTGLGNNPTDVYSNDAVAVYHFGINSSTTDDSTSNGNDGTAYNGTEWVTTGKYGGAFEFDGVDDYIDIGTTDFFSDNFTISAWVNFSSLSPIQHILAKGDNDR